MADVKISQLTELTTPTGNEELVYAYGGANWKIKLDNTKNVKVFTISGTSDLTNAQSAYNWWNNGWVPIIKYSDDYYTLTNLTTNSCLFKTTWTQNSQYLFNEKSLQLTINSWTVISITEFNPQIQKVASVPASPKANTIYLITN